MARRPEAERRFELFGSQVRILVGEAPTDDQPAPELSAIAIEAQLRLLHNRLTRFDPGSELSALNDDPRASRSVSETILAFVGCAIRAYRGSGGLVDSVMLDALERNGYAEPWTGARRVPLAEALREASRPRPAAARPDSPMALVSVDPVTGIVERPVGARLDSGALGKGMAADLAATRLGEHASFVVDVGGDLRIGGANPLPRAVEIAHPLDGHGLAASFRLASGGVATSGLANRIWSTERGFAHHLIDPSTGKPAWTGVIQTTALAPTATGAEVLAKTALLCGPELGREVLTPFGGVLVRDDGSIELVGELRDPTLRPADREPERRVAGEAPAPAPTRESRMVA